MDQRAEVITERRNVFIELIVRESGLYWALPILEHQPVVGRITPVEWHLSALIF